LHYCSGLFIQGLFWEYLSTGITFSLIPWLLEKLKSGYNQVYKRFELMAFNLFYTFPHVWKDLWKNVLFSLVEELSGVD